MYNSLSAGAVDAVMMTNPAIQYAIQKGQDLLSIWTGKQMVALPLV